MKQLKQSKVRKFIIFFFEKLTGKALLILTAVEVPIMPPPMTQIFILQKFWILKTTS